VQDPDKTKNYEIGVKGDVLNHLLSYDASIYYIDWKDIQITLIDPVDSTGYGANGGGAKSEGVELSLEARPVTGLTISSWVTFDEAELTESLGADSTAYGPAGSRLPFGTRWSGNLSLKQDFPITGSLTGFAGGTVSYVGDRVGAFLGDATPRQDYPGYVRADIRGGLNYGQWTGNLYVNNLADRRGVTGGGLGTTPVFAFDYIQPRTVGVSLIARF
jgi:outer membrane receptor protein involved in Fe transport